MLKERLTTSLILILMLSLLCACGTANAESNGQTPSGTVSNGVTNPIETEADNAAGMILGAYSTKTFSNENVSDDALTQILQAGIQAPSAVNTQPWKFIVVNNSELRTSILNNVASGCAIVLVAVPIEAYMMGGNSQFAAGAAAESMYLMAQALGLGAHMYTAPVSRLNNDAAKKEALGIPSDYEVAVVLCFGYIENEADATSSATTRKDFDSFVSYVE
jgi:nitroreductase